MKLKRLLLILTVTTTLGTLTAQDIHFTLFNMSPLTLNPALTGAYEGTARLGGIYRGQWSKFTGGTLYKTPSIYLDAPIVRGFRKNDWIGVGLMTYTDNAGNTMLKTGTQMFSASYHLALDKTGKTILTLGFQGGNVQRSINQDSLVFESDIRNNGVSEDGKFEKKSYLDFNTGIMLRTAVTEASGLELGVAFEHITQPKYGFGSSNQKKLMRINVHSRFENQLTDQWSVAPTLLFQSMGQSTEIALQGWAGYQFTPEYKFNFGAGYRFGRDLQALLGVDFKEGLRVAGSFDINTSSLTNATNGQGFEIAAWYIFKIYKKPSVKPSILCPQF